MAMKNDFDVENLEVDEFTSVCVVSGDTEMLVSEIWDLMQTNEIRHVPIMEKERAVGILSERDVLPLVNLNYADKVTAKEVMTQDPFIVESGSLLKKVVFDMSSKKIGSALVEDENGKVIGIFTSIDALNALNEIL